MCYSDRTTYTHSGNKLEGILKSKTKNYLKASVAYKHDTQGNYVANEVKQRWYYVV